MSDIFVSYASRDRARVEPIIRALEARGWSVFWDRSTPVGQTWRDYIAAELESCRAMLVVWSEASLESEWVLEEAEEAKARRTLFPILIDRVDPPFGFRRIQAADFVDKRGADFEAAVAGLVEQLAAQLGSPGEAEAPRPATRPPEPVPAPPKPASRPKWLLPGVLGGAAVLVGVVLALVFGLRDCNSDGPREATPGETHERLQAEAFAALERSEWEKASALFEEASRHSRSPIFDLLQAAHAARNFDACGRARELYQRTHDLDPEFEENRRILAELDRECSFNLH